MPTKIAYVWTISLVDDAGPYTLAESEDETFETIEAAVEDAKPLFDEIDEAEIVQVFREPGTSFDHLVAGWSPSEGLTIFTSK